MFNFGSRIILHVNTTYYMKDIFWLQCYVKIFTYKPLAKTKNCWFTHIFGFFIIQYCSKMWLCTIRVTYNIIFIITHDIQLLYIVNNLYIHVISSYLNM